VILLPAVLAGCPSRAKVDLAALLVDLARRESMNCTSRRRSRLNGRLSCREGLVDEFVVYLAPKLIGQGRGMASFGPLTDLAQAVPLTFSSAANDRTGPARSSPGAPAGTSSRQVFHCMPASRTANPCENARMFTGIITGVGRIAAVHDLGSSLDHGKRLTIEAPAGYLDDVVLGDSIALNGACMTVTTLTPEQQRFTIDISAESLRQDRRLGPTGPGQPGKALRASDRLGGHIVSGHVDGVGRSPVSSRSAKAGIWRCWPRRTLANTLPTKARSRSTASASPSTVSRTGRWAAKSAST
jgi:hypothetical protein